MIPGATAKKHDVLAQACFYGWLPRPKYEHKSVAFATRYANIGWRIAGVQRTEQSGWYHLTFRTNWDSKEPFSLENVRITNVFTDFEST